jgi:Zn-dependent protease
MSWRIALLMLPGLIIGITVHEASHALSAKLLGDGLSQRQGRISLNPFRHLSLLGTAALFVLGFGWGKPVEVNLYNFKRPKLYYLLSSLAGPASNIVLAAAALGIMYLRPHGLVALICYGVYLVNAMLAVVNLLPIPPLDGSKIWPCLIPGVRPAISRNWGRLWLILLLIIFFTGGIAFVLKPVFNLLFSLLPWK